MLRSNRVFAATAFLAMLAGAMPAWAQLDILKGGAGKGGSGAGAGQQPVVTVDAGFTPSVGEGTGTLSITAKIAPGWHIYSITQKPGGPLKTRIVLEAGPDYEIAGNFTPAEPPESSQEPLFDNLDVETHEGEVTWKAGLKLKPGVDPEKVQIKGRVIAQACNAGSCLPPAPFEFTAKASQSSEPAQPATPAVVGVIPAVPRAVEEPASQQPAPLAYRPEAQHITLRGQLRRISTDDGQKVAELILRAEPDMDWHVYALAKRDPALANPDSDTIGKPTLIVIEKSDGLKLSDPVPSEKPAPQLSKPGEAVTPPWYARPVDWTIRIPLSGHVNAEQHTVTGLIGFQVCHNQVGKCDQPGAARFSVSFSPKGDEPSEPIPVSFTKAKAYMEVANIADRLAATEAPAVTEQAAADLGALPLMLGFAFLGGLILNLMPCVLPVIGLKILSFVEQAGQRRHQILMLNVWYTLGILLVFWVLAGLAVTFKLGWGQQFSSTSFNIVLSALLFVMALSFLGVWEIPIPGFVGGSKASAIAAKEGAVGAISKGAVTTILATPCSGPLLGSVFGFTLNQPPSVTFALFTAIGLGMSGPYLLIGAFPGLVKLLPKPGAWMETFKQAMGFVLLGTVVFLFTFLKQDYLVPTFALLVGLWAACWWIGRIPFTATRARKGRSWVAACAFASVVGLAGFTYLVPGETIIPWKPFSRPVLAQLSAEGKTVMVDFTAKWCLTCKMNLKWAIDTRNVHEVVKANDVVPLLADWTDGSDEITETLHALESKSIPVLAIFPAGSAEPIILRDLLSEQDVLNALNKAGPSKAKSPTNTTVMVEESADRG